jgi:hypothetical protein
VNALDHAWSERNPCQAQSRQRLDHAGHGAQQGHPGCDGDGLSTGFGAAVAGPDVF